MYSSLKDLHSYWAFAVLGILIIAILNSFSGLNQKKPFLDRDKKIAMFALIFAHVQFVIGAIMLFTSPYFEAAKQLGMGVVMKDSTLRLYLVEHPLINIIAITLITIGWSKHKKAADDAVKFKKLAYLYTAGLLLLLSRIPWSTWLS
jgi:hypothetical protein